MPVLHPLVTPLVWLRFLLGFLVIVAIPGHLLVGRFAGTRRRGDACLLAVAAGLLAAPPTALLLGLAGLPVTPWSHLALVLVLALAAGRWTAYREAMGRLGELLGSLPRWTDAAILAVCVVFAAVVIWGLRDFPVPPTVHDAANHAFMTLRIAETSTYDPEVIFGQPWGAPAVPYLPGWHLAAALVARTGGLPPYLAAWALPLVCLFLLPAFWSLFWRACGLPGPVVVIAAALVTANPGAPAWLLVWGGLGVMVGMALVPVAVLLLGLLLARPGAATALPAGVALAALVHIHAGEVALALLAVPVLLSARRTDLRCGRWSWRPALVLVVLLALLLPRDAGPTVATYRTERLVPPSTPGIDVHGGLALVSGMAGESVSLRILLVAGCLLALGNPRRRGLALAALVLALLVFGLAVWRDPVTRLLTLPFYGEGGRVLTAAMLFAPVLAALPLAAALEIVRRRRPRLRPLAVLVVLAAVLVLVRPGLWRGTGGVLRSEWLRGYTLFDDAAWRVARSVEAAVPQDAWVANSYDDGTAWGLHVGRRPHLVPCGWGLVPREGPQRNQGVVGLLERPWPALTRRLAAHRVTHFFASNRYIGGKRTTDVETFASDDRFELVTGEGDFALYRIRWEAEDVPLGDRPRAGD